MLDKEVIKEFLESYLENLDIPQNIDINDLADVFIDYCEDDYYEWFKDNAKSFFARNDGIDWDSIIKRIRNKKKQNS